MTEDLNFEETPEQAFEALSAVINALQPLQRSSQARILNSVSTFLGLATNSASNSAAGAQPAINSVGQFPLPNRTQAYPPFSDDTSMTPKEFLLAKQPRTDVERIAVLAYYLTHFRDMPHFKTLDLSKLNTEAAQPKFSNASLSSNNAVKQHYLATSTKGQRQISGAGELFVNALPDRDAAREAMATSRPRRKTVRKKAPGKSVKGS